MRAFIKKTVDLMISGVLFFIPIYALVAILKALHQQMEKFAKLASAYFPVDNIVGFTLASLFGWLFVIGALVLLGLISKTRSARRVSKAVEENVLDLIPGYKESSERIRAKLSDQVDAYNTRDKT